MPKYAGAINGKIQVVSDTKFNNSTFEVFELPKELESATYEDLFLNYRVKEGKFINKREKKKAKDLKIAFVSNWKMECGIASYAKSLYSEIIKEIGDYKLFVEYNKNPLEPLHLINNEIVSNEKVIECWKRGENLNKLVEEIKKYDPDIILINMEFGIFPYARAWLSMMSQLSDYRIITTMHSVFYHMDKAIMEASMKEIIVHLDGAKDVLVNHKKISGKVNVIHHGCEPIENQRLWNLYKSNQTFMQFGYMFKYKGYENSLYAVSLLKKQYPNVFFTGLCSESPYAKLEHQKYFEELSQLIEKLNIKDNVALIRGYQSETILDAYLNTNKVAIFPYVSNINHECFGSSGAAPKAMTKSLPVITSNVHHFAGLPTIKADTPQEIADCLDKLFTDNKHYQEQVKKQNTYLLENSWGKIAQEYIKIFEMN